VTHVELEENMAALVFVDNSDGVGHELLVPEGLSMNRAILIAGCISMLIKEADSELNKLIDIRLREALNIIEKAEINASTSI
jgi:hypothetical protein